MQVLIDAMNLVSRPEQSACYINILLHENKIGSSKEDEIVEKFMNSSSICILYPCIRYYLFLPYIFSYSFIELFVQSNENV